MVSSKPLFPLGLTNWVLMAWSAAGEPVNRPVLIAPGLAAMVLARAVPEALP